MYEYIRAVYEEGVFRPVSPCVFPENSQVDLIVRPAAVEPPLEPDPQKRREILEQLIERWSTRCLSPEAPRLTRDQMHERG